MSGAPLLSLRGLRHHFRRGLFGRPDPLPSLDEVDLELLPGEVVALIGESGSGKTTLGRVGLGLITPTAGERRLLGEPLGPGGPGAALRRRAQLLYQNADAHLNPGLSLRAAVTESARLHRPAEEPAAVVDRVLAAVGLRHRIDARPDRLSGGERRRAGIARVLVADPDLLVADEPTSGLDAGLRGEIVHLLLARHTPQRGLLLISHDLPVVRFAAQRALVMLAGRVVESLPVRALGAGPHHPYTAALLRAAELGPTGLLDVAPAGRGVQGCPFVGPCPQARPACATHRPALTAVAPDHLIACPVVGSPA